MPPRTLTSPRLKTVSARPCLISASSTPNRWLLLRMVYPTIFPASRHFQQRSFSVPRYASIALDRRLPHSSFVTTKLRSESDTGFPSHRSTAAIAVVISSDIEQLSEKILVFPSIPLEI